MQNPLNIIAASPTQALHDQEIMRFAIIQARVASELGEVPIGAVVYQTDPTTGQTELLAQAHNLRESSADPTAHAEILAMKMAAKKLGTWRLDGCGLAVTLEPCPMCAGAMINARMDHCIYGITDPKMGCVDTLHQLLADERFNHRLPWRAGVLKEECLELLQTFFKARRGKNKPPKPTFKP